MTLLLLMWRQHTHTDTHTETHTDTHTPPPCPCVGDTSLGCSLKASLSPSKGLSFDSTDELCCSQLEGHVSYTSLYIPAVRSNGELSSCSFSLSVLQLVFSWRRFQKRGHNKLWTSAEPHVRPLMSDFRSHGLLDPRSHVHSHGRRK